MVRRQYADRLGEFERYWFAGSLCLLLPESVVSSRTQCQALSLRFGANPRRWVPLIESLHIKYLAVFRCHKEVNPKSTSFLTDLQQTSIMTEKFQMREAG
jgi:hypothetical protein